MLKIENPARHRRDGDTTQLYSRGGGEKILSRAVARSSALSASLKKHNGAGVRATDALSDAAEKADKSPSNLTGGETGKPKTPARLVAKSVAIPPDVSACLISTTGRLISAPIATCLKCEL